MAGTVAERMGLTRTSFFGSWTLYAVLALSALLFGAGLGVLRKALPR